MEKSGVTMQKEAFKDCMSESTALLNAHWEECAGWKDKIKLNVDEARYIAAESNGVGHCFTMREDGRLIGYMVILLAPHIHYKDDKFAYVDVLFMDKERRKGLSAVKFMKWVESEVKRMGAAVMTYHIKTFHDYPAIFERLGFSKVEVNYAKCLKE